MSGNRVATALVGVAALASAGMRYAQAADIVLTPPANGSVSVTDATGTTPRFVFKENGALNFSAAGSITVEDVPFIRNLFSNNLFIGILAGNASTSGVFNIGIGYSALRVTSTGRKNTAIGESTMFNNTTGGDNVAIGYNALKANGTASDNVAVGAEALLSNTFGHSNTASGRAALSANTTGNDNTAHGANALASNISGGRNTAIGNEAMFSNTTASDNVAVGDSALRSGTTTTYNVAIGNGALALATTAGGNVAVGRAALSKTTGGSNIGIGASAGSNVLDGGENIHIGSSGQGTDNGTIRIGSGFTQRAFIAGIRGKTTAGSAIAVVIDGDGQLGTVSSSASTKDDIADMSDATSDLMKLRPVTFHYKADHDPAGRTLQYGLVAEEVEQVYPGLVAHSPDGKVETVMYQFLPPMLLNEFQKQQREIATLRSELAEIRQQLKARP